MQSIKIKKGLNIPIAGSPEQKIDSSKPVNHVALVATEFLGIKPKILVQVGQKVRLGESIFIDKRDTQVQYVSPATGRIIAINRGQRRKLQSVVIELDKTAAPEVEFDIDLNSSGDAKFLRKVLLNSGLWTSFRERPYNRVAHSTSTPASVFVTAIDTRPLSANPNVIIAHYQSEFMAGMRIISQLGDWPVHLCTAVDWSGPTFDGDSICMTQFDGPHPAGLVGTHIHHLDPVAADRMVWHIGYQDVIAIGHLFQTGQLLTDRIISIAGVAVNNPRLLKTHIGANINEIINKELAIKNNYRIISGSVLDGTKSDGTLGYLGRYDNQISVIADFPQSQKHSWFAHVLRKTKVVNTASHGRQSAMVPVEAFDRIMPLDILLTPLLRALLVKDTVAAENLGCLELAEEDLALSAFICPAKQNYAVALRLNLNQIEQEG